MKISVNWLKEFTDVNIAVEELVEKIGAQLGEVEEVKKVGNDNIVDIENKMFTHRPDCFGLLGVAREVAGITRQAFKSPEWYLSHKSKTKVQSSKELEVKNEITDLVPRFMARVVERVKVQKSSKETQDNLSRVSIKPQNNIVDLTNYYMCLTAQPTHAFDYDKVKALSADIPTLKPRLAKKGEKLTLLGGKEIELTQDDIVIATDKKAIGLAGVMGGAETEVDESTKNIIVECASFDRYKIHGSAMRHGLFTDAATRFSKGQSPLQQPAVLAKVVEEIIKSAGGSAGEVIDLKQEVGSKEGVKVSARFINDRLGSDLPAKEIARMLRNVEFGVEAQADELTITPPFWRQDIAIPEDIVEEVGRLFGYDNLPLEFPKKPMTPSRQSPELKTKQEIRDRLSRAGANETLNYSFVHKNLLDKSGQDAKEAFRLTNALSPDLQYYRLSLTPSLLEKVHPNIKAGFEQFALFEIGQVHGKSQVDDDSLPKEFGRVGLIFASKKQLPGAAYYQVLPYLMALARDNVEDLELKPAEGMAAQFKSHKLFAQLLAPFDSPRSALVYSGEKLLGIVGEYRPEVSQALKLPTICVGFELFLSPFASEKIPPAYTTLSDYPSTSQDICLRTGQDINFSKIADELRKALGKHAQKDHILWDFECIDIYQKDSSHKHTTFRVEVYSHEKTLTSQESNDLMGKVVDDLKKSIKAERV